MSLNMTTSACDETKISVKNANVKFANGDPQTITIISAGPANTNGGSLTQGGNSTKNKSFEVAYGDVCTFEANSSEGSEGEFHISFAIQCNAATSSDVNVNYEMLNVATHGDCSTTNSKKCSVGGDDQSTDNFSATITQNSECEKGDNWISITIANA